MKGLVVAMLCGGFVGIQLGVPGISRRALLAEAADGIGDVGFEVDVIETGGDRLTQQGLPFVFLPAPAAAVDRSAELSTRLAPSKPRTAATPTTMAT